MFLGLRWGTSEGHVPMHFHFCWFCHLRKNSLSSKQRVRELAFVILRCTGQKAEMYGSVFCLDLYFLSLDSDVFKMFSLQMPSALLICLLLPFTLVLPPLFGWFAVFPLLFDCFATWQLFRAAEYSAEEAGPVWQRVFNVSRGLYFESVFVCLSVFQICVLFSCPLMEYLHLICKETKV